MEILRISRKEFQNLSKKKTYVEDAFMLKEESPRSICGIRSVSWWGMEIVGLFTFEEHRNKGYATTLVKEVLKKFKGIPFFATVKKDNIPSRKVFTKAGFSIMGEFYNPFTTNELFIFFNNNLQESDTENKEMEFSFYYKDNKRIILKNKTERIETVEDLFLSISPYKIRFATWFPEEYETGLITDYDEWKKAFREHKAFFNWLKKHFESWKKIIVEWYNEDGTPHRHLRYEFYRKDFRNGKEEFDKFCKELLKDEKLSEEYEKLLNSYDRWKEIEDWERI